MGTRVNYEIADNYGNVGIVLYVNNSHEDVDTDQLFVDTLRHIFNPNSAIQRLLDQTYPSTKGNHRTGERIFTVDFDQGDREYVVRATLDGIWEGVANSVSFTRDNLDGTTYGVDPETLELFSPEAPPAP